MALSPTAIVKLAKVLDRAIVEAYEIERLTLAYPDLSLSDAYLVQEEGIRMRLARGERQVGLKMGLTSKAKREQMNLHLPIYGVLTDRMQVKDEFSLEGTIHPKIEPEVAFIVGRELKGKVNLEQAREAVSGVCAALEILDSRYLNFKYFSLPDVVADNCSSAYFVLGKPSRSIEELDLANLKMAMEVDGKPVQTALSSEISGNPLNSLVQLCDLLSSRGLSLKEGSIVLAGAATQAVQLSAGMNVRLNVDGLDSVGVKIC